jgi:hypothetical protein
MTFALPLRICVLLGLLLGATAFAQQFQYTTLQVPGSTYTVALGVNNNGDIVGTYISNGVQSGFLYSGGNFQTIACPGAAFTLAQGINDNGVVVGWCGNNPTKGFVYQSGSYSYVSYPGASLTALLGINKQGEMVGACQGCGRDLQRGFVYSNGVFTFPTIKTNSIGEQINYIGGINSSSTLAADACYARCQVGLGVVYVKCENGWCMQNRVKYPGALGTGVDGINDNGDLAGAWGPTQYGQQEGFVYFKNTNTFIGFDIQNSGDMAAEGINISGEIVGFYTVGTTFYGFYGQLNP